MHELLVEKQLEALSGAGVLNTEPHQGCERHTLGFHDGSRPSEPGVTEFMAKQMDFTGRRRPTEKG